MQILGIQRTEEQSSGTRCSTAYIGMDTAFPADIGQDQTMANLHTVHFPGQRKIIQMNPCSMLFRTSRFAVG